MLRIITLAIAFLVPPTVSAGAQDFDGEWNYELGFDPDNANCGAFGRPGTLSIKNGRVHGTIPYLLDDFRLTGKVGETITGVWEYDSIIFTMYIDLGFGPDQAVGKWSLSDLGCSGAAKLTRIKPSSGGKSSTNQPPSNREERLSELKKLLDQGLISKEEAADKRREILDDL